ncbi:MAG: hypothetical protein ACFFFH_02040 [Candidatus Thorarchaeota archaeon]
MGEARGAGAPGPGGWPKPGCGPGGGFKPGCGPGGWPKLGCGLAGAVDNPGRGGRPDGTDGGAAGEGELGGGVEAVTGAGGAGRPLGTLVGAGAGGEVLWVVSTGGLKPGDEMVGDGLVAAAPPL